MSTERDIFYKINHHIPKGLAFPNMFLNCFCNGMDKLWNRATLEMPAMR